MVRKKYLSRGGFHSSEMFGMWVGRRLKHRVFGEEYLSLSSRVRFHGDNVTVICNCHLVSRQKTER